MKRMLAWLYAPLVFAGFIGAGVWLSLIHI